VNSIIIDWGAGGGYLGPDRDAYLEFQRIATNWGQIKLLLEVSGILPTLFAKITSTYSSGYSWSEVVEESDGTFTLKSGGRQSGVGVYPKAFEKNGGQAAITNAIVTIELSADPDTGETTACFDAKGARVAADDFITPTSLAFDNTTRVLTIGRLTAQRDIFGRVMGVATPANLTATIGAGTAGGFDAYQEGGLIEAAVVKIDIPTTTGSSTILAFVDGIAAGEIELRMKAAADYQVPMYLGSAWIHSYPRFH
jgi:hypothetical protein